jgi:hypothetical protein
MAIGEDPFDRLTRDALGLDKTLATIRSAQGLGASADVFTRMEADRRRFDELLSTRPTLFEDAARGHLAFQQLLERQPTIFEDIARQRDSFERFVSTGGLAAAQGHLATMNAITAARALAASTRDSAALERIAGARSLIPDMVVEALAIRNALNPIVERFAGGATVLNERFTQQIEGISRLVAEAATGWPTRDILAARFPEIVPALRLPSAAEIADVDLAAASGIKGTGVDWATNTAREMAMIETPWVRDDRPELAIGGFATLKGLTEIVGRTAPAAPRATLLVRTRLGDYREDDAEAEPPDDPMLAAGLRLAHGFDARLASLPLALAGAIFAPFGLVAAAPDADQDQLDDVISHILRKLEQKLRAFIDARLTAAVGERWIRQRVAKPVRDKWEASREADLGAGRPAASLIDYADFGEYRSIIEQGDNWRDAFQAVFGVKTAIGETLARLTAIRNPSAHVRSMSTEDLLILRVEGRRLYVWMGEQVP